MRIISYRKLREFSEVHPESKDLLDAWYTAVDRADWHNFTDLRQSFPSADRYKNCVIFDIGGNRYRLIAWVDYRKHAVYVRHVLTHKEYDNEKWKRECGGS